MTGPRTRLSAAEIASQFPAKAVLTREADDGSELVMTAGEDAGDDAMAAESRFRQSRTDSHRPEGASMRDVEANTRTAWQPPSILPNIEDTRDWHFRWVRVSIHGERDDTNVNQAFREGYVTATLEDVGQGVMSYDRSTRFPGAIEIGGLLLCKIPIESMHARDRYYAQQSHAQVNGIENDVLRSNDPRMPMLRPTFNQRTAFGSGSSRAPQ